MTSHFVKTVTLKEWWLTKADNNSPGHTVAIAGTESSGRQAARLFFSAPIVERLDLFTLKTADGIFVLLKGLINKQQTCDNGFSEEVFKHFLIGFPPNWHECAEKCFQQGIGSEAISDAGLNPEQSTVTKMGNTTAKLKQKLWKDPDCDNRPDHCLGEEQEAVTEVHDDANINNSVEERNLKDALSDAQNQKETSHATAYCQDRDTCTSENSYKSDPGSIGQGKRYDLRQRGVKNVGKGNSFPKKNMMENGTSVPSLASLEKSQTPANTPFKGKSSKENVIGDNNGKNVSGVNYAAESMPKDTGKVKNLISDNFPGVEQCQSKKRKRIERTVEKSTTMTRSSLKKNMEKSLNCGGVAAGDNIIENHNGRNKDENKQIPRHGQLRSARVNIKRKSTHKDNSAAEINVNRSPQNAEKPAVRSKSTVDKKSHDSAKPAVRSCNSRAKIQSKSAVTQQERKASQAQEAICTPKGKKKDSASQGSVLRTSRSGRLLLPAMEFWRNHIPVYDADHGISGIMEGSTILKVNARKGRKACTKKSKRS